MADTKQMATEGDSPPLGKATVIEEGTAFKGSMTSTCMVVVRGRIEGELSTPTLSVAVGGVVQGRARVGALDSQGQLAGEFDADTARLSGTVSDDTVIRAKSLEVKLISDDKRVVTFGESRLEIGDAPVPPKG
jgi:cytoskeletal protein CcmA (bactofilin family)